MLWLVFISRVSVLYLYFLRQLRPRLIDLMPINSMAYVDLIQPNANRTDTMGMDLAG